MGSSPCAVHFEAGGLMQQYGVSRQPLTKDCKLYSLYCIGTNKVVKLYMGGWMCTELHYSVLFSSSVRLVRLLLLCVYLVECSVLYLVCVV